jgi:hypothetical protein
MNNKFDKDIRVYNKLRVFKESSYFYSSFKDTFSKVVRVFGSKQAFFDQQNAFPVLKSSRILRRHTNTDNNKDIDIARSKKKMDLTDKMMIDGNQDANLPSTLQENNNDCTLIASAEDDDDATVQTSNSNSTKQAWTSYNIKLVLLTSKQDTSDSALQHAMLTVLATIDQELGADTKIFDGNKQQVTDFKFQPVTIFRSKFPVSRSKAHQKHNRSAAAWVLFTFQTR